MKINTTNNPRPTETAAPKQRKRRLYLLSIIFTLICCCAIILSINFVLQPPTPARAIEEESGGEVNLTLPDRDSSIITFKDLIYKTAGQQQIKLDLYQPKIHQAEKMPVVVYIHGGDWSGGDKSIIYFFYRQKILNELLKNGYTVASINYRLTNDENIHFPSPVADCKDAVRWLRKNAVQYHLDPENIGLWGTSAGAHLALLAAYTDDNTFTGSSDLAGYSSQVNYSIDHFGPTDLNRLFRPETSDVLLTLFRLYSSEKYHTRQDRLSALSGLDDEPDKENLIALCHLYSPLTYITDNTVPTLIAHGSADKTVPLEQSELLANALMKHHISYKFTIYPGQGHGLRDLPFEDSRRLVQQTLEFINAQQK